MTSAPADRSTASTAANSRMLLGRSGRAWKFRSRHSASIFASLTKLSAGRRTRTVLSGLQLLNSPNVELIRARQRLMAAPSGEAPGRPASDAAFHQLLQVAAERRTQLAVLQPEFDGGLQVTQLVAAVVA